MSIRGQILFNVFINDVYSGIECTFSRFEDDAKLSYAVDMLKGRDAIQSNCEEQAYVNLIKFNKAKCKVPYLSWGNLQYQYRHRG